MIKMWMIERNVRLILAGCFFASGLILAMLFLQVTYAPFVIGLFSVGLASLIGIGKRATP
jgi:hypothetical protein